MKRLLAVLLLFALPAYGADTKVSLDTNLATLASGDEFYCVDDPGGSPLSRACTIDVIQTFVLTGNAATATALAANPAACSANQFVNDTAANGDLTCAQPAFTDLSGAATDAQVPNTITVDLATVATTATTANAGDSATAFFAAGTIEHERGGLEADVSAYAGLVRIDTGATSAVSNLAGLNTAISSGLVTGAHLTEAEARTGLIENGSAEMTIESLGTACAENQIPKANATGGVDCAADADSGGAPAFSAITGATNTTAALVVGSGSTLGATGSGTITATDLVAGSAVVSDAEVVDTITAANYLPLAGGTLTGNLGLADAAGDSPILTFSSQTGTNWYFWQVDADDDMQIGAQSAGVETLDIVNNGAGTTDVNVDGSITVGGTVDGVDIAARDHAVATVSSLGIDADITTLTLAASSTVSGSNTGDDDVPESGDFGNAADLESTGALSIDVVAAAEMADADHGAVSWTSGVATVEDLACTTCVDVSAETNLTAGRSLTLTGDDVLADAELYTHTKSMVIETPADADNFLFFRTDSAITITGIDCLVNAATSAVITVQECDANGGTCGTTEAAITCAATNTTEAAGIDDAAVDAGDYMRIDVGAVTGTVGHVIVNVTYTMDD